MATNDNWGQAANAASVPGVAAQLGRSRSRRAASMPSS
jgi:hypothetical protein